MLRLTNLCCEYMPNPIGLDTPFPRFSWELEHAERDQKQSAYQILVASTQELLQTSTGDLWDSGKVLSECSVNVVYAGNALESGTRYYWKVHAWDKDDRVSAYSSTAVFEMGLLRAEDWQGKWISWDGKGSPLFRREFSLDKTVKRARLYISGLGYYEARINDCKVGEHVLDPGWTDYEKTILYASFDVTDLLKTGSNSIGVMLGNGRFSPPDEVVAKNPNPLKKYGRQPLLIAQLNVEFSDGTLLHVSTNSDWKVTAGPIVFNDLYDGESYDARLERSGWDSPGFDDAEWQAAKKTQGPEGKMVSQTNCPPIKVVRTIVPQTLTTPEMGIFIYDFGQNFTGWVKLKVRGSRGTEVTIRYAELLYEDGTLNPTPNRSAKATDLYILKGEGEEIFEPHFSYHGFRYVELAGFPGTPDLESVEGCFVHSAVPPTGSFLCSHPLINKIHQNVLWGQLSNLMSIPTDCPQRDERLGWLGDAHLTAEEAIHNFEMAGFYTKWMRDIHDAQKDNGSVPDVVPTHWNLYPADPAWGTACILIPWMVYCYYGDRQILQQHYSMMKSYIEYLDSLAQDDMLHLSKYGDWCPPWHVNSVDTPQELVSQWCYYYGSLMVSNIARILGKQKDSELFAKKAERIKDVFNDNFLRGDRYTGEQQTQYLKFIPMQLTGNERAVMEKHLSRTLEVKSQTAHVLALFLDLVPSDKKQAVLQSLIDDIVVLHGNHVNTGIIGTRYILDVLSDNGYADLAFKLVTQTTYPGWGYMLQEGATTMWERWEYLTEVGMNSQNHIMLGSVDAWFYRYLAGIQIDPAEPGWKCFRIRPHILGDLEFVNASVHTVRGLVSSCWIRVHRCSLELQVTVPVNSQAAVSIPTIGLEHMVITEGETEIWTDGNPGKHVAGVSDGREEKDFVTFNVGSGTYYFRVREQ